MSKLDSLKIHECPYAFADFAAKHNALVDLLSAIEGQNGITVVVSEKNAVIRSNGSASSNISGNVTQVVTSTGSLANAYYSNTNANAYPSAGRYVTASGNVDISNTGVVITTSGGKVCNIAFALLTHDMGIKTVSFCNSVSGAIQSMDLIGSEGYT